MILKCSKTPIKGQEKPQGMYENSSQYLVDQAVSPFFCSFIVFILNEPNRYLTSNPCKMLDSKEINSCQPKPEKKN